MNLIEKMNSLLNQVEALNQELKNASQDRKIAIKNELSNLSKQIEEIKERNNQEYARRGFRPFPGDLRYCDYPDKDFLDIIRCAYDEKFKRDLSISYIGTKGIFDNHNNFSANYYSMRVGKNKICLIVGPVYFSNGKDVSLPVGPNSAVLIRLESDYLFSEAATDIIDILLRQIQAQTGSSVDFIYSNNFLNEITFGMIGDFFFSKNEGNKAYFSFFDDDLFDEHIENEHHTQFKNVIYISKKMQIGAPDAEIEKVNELILANQRIISERGIAGETIATFNEQVKSLILKGREKSI